MGPAQEEEAGKGSAGVWGLVALGGLVVVLPAVGAVGLYEPIRELAETVRGQGLRWWAVFVAAAAVLCGAAVMPTHGVSLAAGFMFGAVWGVGAAMASVAAGSGLGWWWSRRAAGDRLRALVSRSGAGRTLTAALVDARGWRAVLAVTLARLPPQVPFALGNLAAASVGVRPGAFLLGTAVGMAPRVAVVAWIGSELATLGPGRDPRGLAVGIAAATVGLVGLGAWSWRVLKQGRSEAGRAG